MTNNISQKLGLICISISAFFYGCVEKDDVASGITSGNLDDAFKVEITDIQAEIVLDNDSISTLNKELFLVGHYTDEVYGDVSAQLFSTLRHATTGFEIESGTVIDSVVLNLLQSKTRTYGRLDSDHNYEVYELTEAIDREADDIYNTTSLPDDGVNLVTSDVFTPYPAQDSILSLTLSNDFGMRLLSYSQDSLYQYFPGIVLKGNENNTTVQGMYPYEYSESNITVYYHTAEEEGLSEAIYFNRTFTNVESSREGTSLSSLVNAGDKINSNDIGNNVFVQAGTGVRSVISFPTLQNMLDTLDGYAVNLAYVEIFVDTTINTDVSVPTTLDLYHTIDDISTGEDTESNSFWGYYGSYGKYLLYNSSSASYKIPVTELINQVLKGERELGKYSFVPSNDAYDLSSIVGYDANSANGEQSMRLVLYFSETTL